MVKALLQLHGEIHFKETKNSFVWCLLFEKIDFFCTVDQLKKVPRYGHCICMFLSLCLFLTASLSKDPQYRF